MKPILATYLEKVCEEVGLKWRGFIRWGPESNQNGFKVGLPDGNDYEMLLEEGGLSIEEVVSIIRTIAKEYVKT
jgi:hypothetical protein